MILGPDLARCLVSQTTVRPLFIILPPPLFNHDLGFSSMPKPFQVETFVTQFPVEAFVRPILPGLACLDIHRLNSLVCEPTLDRLRHKLWPIITPDECRRAMLPDEPLDHLDHPRRRDPTLHFHRQAFARPFVNDRQNFQLLTVGAGIMDKIVGPDMIWPTSRTWLYTNIANTATRSAFG